MNIVLFIMDKQGHWWLEHSHSSISVEELEKLELYVRDMISNKKGMIPKK